MGRVADIDGAGAMADGHAVGAVIVGMAGGAMLVGNVRLWWRRRPRQEASVSLSVAIDHWCPASTQPPEPLNIACYVNSSPSVAPYSE